MKPHNQTLKAILKAPEFEPPENQEIHRQELHDAKGHFLGIAELYLSDFQSLQAQGFTGKLFTKVSGSVRYVVAKNRGVRGDHSVVARLILKAPKGLTVRYRDGNPFNLRRDNFYYETGNAKGQTPVEPKEPELEGAA